MWLPSMVMGAWTVVLALYGRWRLAAVVLAAGWILLLLVAVTVFALIPALLTPVVGWWLAIRVIRRGRPVRWGVLPAIAIFLVPIVPAILLRAFVLEAYRAPSSSMCPSLQIGDHFFVEKLSVRWHAPARGDVIVFLGPDGREFIKRVAATGGDVVAVKHGALSLDGKQVSTTRIAATTYANEDERTGTWTDEPAIDYEEDLDGTVHDIYVEADGEAPPDDHDFPKPGADFGVARCEDATAARTATRVDPDWTVMPMTTAPGGCRVPDGALFVLGDNRDNSSDSRVWGAVPVDRVVGRVVGIWLPADHPSRDWGRMGAIR